MLRRSHILTSAALLAISVVPGSAFAMPDQPASDQPLPPPSSIAQSAGQAYQDLRSPDARDAAVQATETPQVAQDLRSPDARDAALQAAETPQVAQDLRSPDARDAALQSAETTPQVAQDLRSPDARDAALQAAESTPQVAQDLRSPDARDAGRVSPPVQQPIVEIREVPESGFDWGDAGIGAAGILAMLSIATGFTLLVGSRRRRRGVQTAH
jgi:hypothetical protein